MTKLFLLLLLLPQLSSASVEFEKFSYWRSGKQIQVPIAEVDNVKVNDICANKQNKCIALKKLHQKSSLKKMRQAIPGNAAGSYCDFLSGTQLFMQRNGDGLKSQFCVFSDLTMVDAKDLYLRHYGEGRKK